MSKFVIVRVLKIFLVLRLDIFLIGILAITVVESANASSSDMTLSTTFAVDAFWQSEIRHACRQGYCFFIRDIESINRCKQH